MTLDLTPLMGQQWSQLTSGNDFEHFTSIAPVLKLSCGGQIVVSLQAAKSCSSSIFFPSSFFCRILPHISRQPCDKCGILRACLPPLRHKFSVAPVAWSASFLQALTVGTDYCTDASLFGQRAGYGCWNAGFHEHNTAIY